MNKSEFIIIKSVRDIQNKIYIISLPILIFIIKINCQDTLDIKILNGVSNI